MIVRVGWPCTVYQAEIWPRQLVRAEWNAIGRGRREKGSRSWASLSKLPVPSDIVRTQSRVGCRARPANTDYLPHTMRRRGGDKGRVPSQVLFAFLSEQVSPKVTNTRSSLTRASTSRKSKKVRQPSFRLGACSLSITATLILAQRAQLHSPSPP